MIQENDVVSAKKPILQKVESVLRKTDKELSLHDIQDRIGVRNPDWIIDALETLINNGIIIRRWTRKGGGKTVYRIREEADHETEKTVEGAANSDVCDSAIPEKQDRTVSQDNRTAMGFNDESDIGTEENADIFVSALYDHLLAEIKTGQEWKSVGQLIIKNAWPRNAVRILPILLAEMAKEGIIEIQTDQDLGSGMKTVVRYYGGNRDAATETIKQILRQVQLPEEEKEKILNKTAVAVPEPEITEPAADTLREESNTDINGHSQLPYGYRTIKGKIDINKREAEVVQMVFGLHASGKTLTEIANYLNSQGVRARMGSCFYPATISKMLMKKSLYEGKSDKFRLYPPVLTGNSSNIALEHIPFINTEKKVSTSVDNVEANQNEKNEDWRDHSQTPYGYRESVSGNIYINEEEAEVIRAIFKMRAQKKILQVIADRLNDQGKKTKTGKSFLPVTVSDILRRKRVYEGKGLGKKEKYPAILAGDYLSQYNAIADAVEPDVELPEEPEAAPVSVTEHLKQDHTAHSMIRIENGFLSGIS